MDNLIVFFLDWKADPEILEKFLRRLSEAKLIAPLLKFIFCIFEASSVEFLGHHVRYDWITPNDNNLVYIARAKRPVTKKK